MDKDTLDKETIALLLGFSELSIDQIAVDQQRIAIHCHSTFESIVCPSCLHKTRKVKSEQVRVVRDMAVFGKEIYLHLTSRQFHCEVCNRYFYEQFSFVESNKQMTSRLEQYLYLCLKESSFKQVSVRENVFWDVLQGIFERYAKRQVRGELTYVPTRIGIDEFAYRKGKKDYALVIVDLDKGCVWDVLEERSKESLLAYFQGKGQAFCEAIQLVSCDRWEGFSRMAKQVFPQAEVVIDRFHFFAHLHQVLDAQRRHLRKKYPQQVPFKAIKWLLYKPWEKLRPAQRNTLLKAFRLCATLRQLYFLKNELQNIFNASLSKAQAEEVVEQWIKQGQVLAHPALNVFLKTFLTWKNDVLNFFNTRLSNGIVEGINNASKTLKRVAYGFRNFQHFRLPILVNFI